MGRPPRVSRDDVLRAAREAFAERGYEGTTLAAIGARVGVSPAALLRHAPDKHALFAAAMAAGEAEDFPMAFLADADPREDPRLVLRRLAETAIPFLESALAENIARWMYARTAAGSRTLRIPFDPRSRTNPPRRVLVLLEDYLRRASRAGRVRVKDARAAALSFMGSINAWVFFNRMLKIVDPPFPLERYLDTVLEIWTRGAIRRPAAARRGPR
jgi:AcrR family transcriptional regulator